MELRDFEGKPIRTIEEYGRGSKLALLYPGYAYGLSAPLFFYLRRLLADRGWDVLGFDYRYNENEAFQAAEEERQDAWFLADSLAIGRAAASAAAGKSERGAGTYGRVLYVGKSLGTTMLYHQNEAGLLSANAEFAVLTPGTTAKDLYAMLGRTAHRSLVVYGSADPHSKAENVALIGANPAVTVVPISDAGHLFEVAGNAGASIAKLGEALEALDRFIR